MKINKTNCLNDKNYNEDENHGVQRCLICDSPLVQKLNIQQKIYFQCSHCEFIFLDAKHRLTSEQEKKRYQLHQNNVLDPGYQCFVTPLLNQVTSKHSGKDLGLDYGSGVNSAISYLLNQSGFQVLKYDPYFFHEELVLQESKYDYIIACEVAEHFYFPKDEFEKMHSWLKPEGNLFVMTSLKTSRVDFANWSYRRDPTHVSFYSEKTCFYLQQYFHFSSIYIFQDQIVVFQKK